MSDIADEIVETLVAAPTNDQRAYVRDVLHDLERDRDAANERADNAERAMAKEQRGSYSSVVRDMRMQLDAANAGEKLWRTRCKEAQRCIDDSMACSFVTPKDDWLIARDAGEDE